MASAQSAATAAASGRSFYLTMAFTCLAVAVLGFAPTYFLPLANGKFAAPPLVHIHGLLFFSWTLFLCAQTWLVNRGRTLAHREWGVLGVAIATGMVFTVFTTAIFRINQLEPLGMGPAIRAFSWVQVSGIIFFAVVFALAIAKVRDPETHKRLMLLATISLLDAPIARWFLTFLAPPAPPGQPVVPPVFVTVPPAIVADLLIVAVLVFDWRTRGRPHRVYVVGGLALLAIQLTRPLIAATPQWDALATLLGRLGAA
ncbi:MAG: hypothetical protein Q8M88_01390 [Phenylobacterium sp.]|uniref:hypothetical protein n=1 Tax=Phenylobacterium sp. TaxID=1871053 RepID=UPI0027323CC1|nr:hypothetical protein [Phenylobacterium sp.]MDP3173072.1 hypothetical protein [Phenylobacterium sp.]